MRVAIVSNSRYEEDVHDAWFGMMRQSLQKVLRPETQVELRSPRRGLASGAALDFDNAYFTRLNDSAVGEAIVAASREGFDAISVACFGDPCVREVRAAVETPVLGAGETAILVASLIGRRMGIIATRMPEQVGPIHETVRRMGMSERVIPNGIRLDAHDVAETFEKGFRDPGLVAEAVESQARELVAEGADVIVVGCCATGPFCSAAGFSSFEDGGRRIPVIDPVVVTTKLAESAADLRDGAGLPFTTFAQPSAEDVDRVHALFEE
ncbi:MAG: aspartate/glutamate racemase family protein [Myxococcota bacterium]